MRTTVLGVTIRLAVNEAPWLSHVQTVARSYQGLVPVVKGNGYGFRRWNLMPLAGQLGNEVAVGTVFEVRDIPSHVTPIVLTPTLTHPPKNMPMNTVLTVGSVQHVMALAAARWRGEVIVKLQSSAMRYGVSRDNLVPLLADINAASLTVRGYAIHPPLAGDDAAHLKDIARWLGAIAPGSTVYVSHLSAEAYAHLAKSFPNFNFRIRVGTSLWHGDKSMMHLTSDVVDHHPVESGDKAGYRLNIINGPGEIVLVGCGTAHGVMPLEDGRSPFHYQRQRLNMLEPPHMHTTMLFVARGRPIPSIGEWIDVQQPLSRVQVDLLQWIK
jgi:alanine racemase